jgi:predicted MFS family arabinose efflux permease
MSHIDPIEISLFTEYVQKNLWSRPTAAYISKRYTILFSMLLFIVCNVWGARAQSSKSLLASRIVGGLGGVVETLGPEIISELFPEHQLARAMFVYTFSLAAGAGLGPIVAVFVATGTGTWRWFLWIIVIAGVVNFISLVLMMPETTPLVDRSQAGLNSRETVSTMEESGK